MVKKAKKPKVMNVPDVITGNPGWLERCRGKMDDLQAAVKKTGGKGAITIQIEVDASGVNDSGVVNQFSFDMKKCEIKIPIMPLNKDLWFINPEGELQKRDPRQPDIPRLLDDEDESQTA